MPPAVPAGPGPVGRSAYAPSRERTRARESAAFIRKVYRHGRTSTRRGTAFSGGNTHGLRRGGVRNKSRMHFKVLATDYDGTLAWHGAVAPATIGALEEVRGSGRQLVMVTGREVNDLLSVFNRLDLFDLVVAENGAVLYRPRDGRIKLLAEPPPKCFMEELRARNVTPLSAGHVVVATLEPHELTVVKLIRDLGLELQVIFNKGAVMVLPSGVNKASGLKAGLRQIGLSIEETVGIGDAENDHALLEICACGVAVENAVPTLKDHADFVTRDPNGGGVRELIGRLLANDLADLSPRQRKRQPVEISG